MKKLCLLTMLLATLQLSTFAQEKATAFTDSLDSDFLLLLDYQDSLENLSKIVLTDTLEDARFLACNKMVKTLVAALKIDNSFSHNFACLEQISFIYPPDSSFRIITWQLYVNPNTYRYYGAIQMNDKKLKLFPLIDRSEGIVNAEQKVLSPEKWYGALYYNIKEVDAPFGKYYMLFGFKANTFFTRRKLVEVLTFEENKPVFGAPVMAEKVETMGMPPITRTYNRYVMEYSADASATLNYSEDYGLIIFDHLIQTGGVYKNQGQIQVPDGSYRGFKLGDDGKWHFVNKVFNDYQADAPMPTPVLRNRKDGLFGPKNKK